MITTVPEFVHIEQIKISPLRPTLSDIPYIKPSAAEIETARITGLISPVVIKEIRRIPYPVYHILKGEKNWFLAQSVKVSSISCELVIDKISEEHEKKIIKDDLDSYQLNIITQKIDPIAEAQAFKDKLRGYDSRYQFCKDKKIDQGTLAHKLNLLKLSIEVQALIKDSKLKPTHVRFLYQIKNESNQLKIALHIIETKRSTSQSWEICKRFSTKKTNTNVDSDLALIERLTSERLGYPVKIKQNKKGSGEIRIKYFDTDGADDILKKLGYQGDEF